MDQREVAEQQRAMAEPVPCPKCGALAGQRCIGAGYQITVWPHASRQKAARRVLPVSD